MNLVVGISGPKGVEDALREADRANARCLLPFIALLAALSGCGGDGPTQPPASVPDTTLIWLAIEESGFADDALFPTGEIAIADPQHLEPVAFRRLVTHVDLFREPEFSDPNAGNVPQTARVMICKYQKGELHAVQRYAPDDPTPADSSDRIFEKTLRADWFRSILLRRDASATHGWRVTGVSEAYLLIDNKRLCCHANIAEVRVRRSGVEIAMPIGPDFLGIDSLVHLDPSVPLQVVVVAANNDDIVLLHDAAGPHRLSPTGAATFEGMLTLGAAGLRQFTVEAFTESTLTDPAIRPSHHGYTMAVMVGPVSAPDRPLATDRQPVRVARPVSSRFRLPLR